MQGAAVASKNIFHRHLDAKFNLPDNAYKPIDKIGTGAYGVVCSALHRKSGEKVAIKKIPNAFQELTTAKRTYRELKILQHFNNENIIGIREILNPREGVSELKDVYVVMDLMESDLHQIIHSTQPFSLEHIRYFLYQILRGLKHIHSANVVHRDLKPSNLLVNENCELKIGDFGMARGISSHQDAGAKKKVFMTAYVATRWYRAPELLFSNDVYSFAVDTWSVGCIFAEMMGRKQIFPGKNPMHQLTLIVEALGMPPDYMLKSTNSEQIYNFFHKNFSNHKPVDFHAKYPGANKKAIDLLSKMLIFNPADRISIKDALKHPFLSKYHDPDDEPDCFPLFDFAFEQDDLKKEQIRQRVGKMILKYQKITFGPPKLTIQPKSDPPASNDLLFQACKDPVTQPPTKSVTLQQQQQPLQPVVKDTQSTVFKKPAAPIPHSQTTIDLKGSMKPVNDPLDIMRGLLCVKTEQGFPTNSTDVVMKSASTESHPANVPSSQNLFATSTTTSINTSDFCMRSAGSSVSQKGTSKEPSQKTNLTVSPKELTTPTMSDVEMKSAKGTPPVSSSLSNNLGDLSDKVHPAVEDVAMYSAGSPKITPGVKEETKLGDVKADTQVGENTMSAALGVMAGGDNQSISKTISNDTKALIKAALLNSALKNKLRKDSTSGLCSKGGGKVTVTAQSRQREREEKRRQKLQRSQEKKKKSKGQSQENSVLLTEADKGLLEKWKKMQEKAPTNSQSKRRLHSESSLSANDENKPATLPQKNVAIAVDSNASKVSNVPVLSKSNRMEVAPQHLLGAVKNVQQLNMALAADTRTMPNQRRIMPKVTSAVTGATIVTSGTTIPSTFTYQLTVGQNIVNPSTSQTASVFAPNVTGSGVPLNSNPINNPSQVMTYSLPQNPVAGISGLNNFQQEKNTDSFQPITSVPNKPVQPNVLRKENSSISDDKSYRSRIFSDRETPSPPLAISPPTYEEAVKAKQKTKNSAEEHDFSLSALDDISPFKPSPTAKLDQAASLPFRNDSSNQDLASLIQNLDILPPTLVLTPKGDGAGYGLELDFEDLLGRTFDIPHVGHPLHSARPLDSAPLSPSLFDDWLELHNLNKDEMQRIQQDVGMTSPINISDLGSLGNISPPTKS